MKRKPRVGARTRTRTKERRRGRGSGDEDDRRGSRDRACLPLAAGRAPVRHTLPASSRLALTARRVRATGAVISCRLAACWSARCRSWARAEPSYPCGSSQGVRRWGPDGWEAFRPTLAARCERVSAVSKLDERGFRAVARLGASRFMPPYTQLHGRDTADLQGILVPDASLASGAVGAGSATGVAAVPGERSSKACKGSSIFSSLSRSGPEAE